MKNQIVNKIKSLPKEEQEKILNAISEAAKAENKKDDKENEK